MTSDSSKDGRRLLDGVRRPADVKAIREQDLPQLAQEVREELIKVLSQTGGHLGPNLGVVELTIALHRVFDTPRDRFVFDVSHQGYVHKMFTGRLDRIGTMRQYQGLNGFLLRTESEHDCYGAGHAGTALSAGLGMAVGRDLRGADDQHVVVVAGDAAFTCGISYEALNNAKSQTKRFIVVLNDNEWSIAKNVGAIASYFNTITTHPMYAGLHEKARRFIKAVAGRGAVHLAHKFEEGVKNLLVPSVQAAHPDRYYDVGIAEEHAALFACGLATQGLKPTRDRKSRSGAAWARGCDFRTRQHVRSRGGSSQETGGKGNFGRAHQPALDQTARHRDAGIFCPQRGSRLHY